MLENPYLYLTGRNDVECLQNSIKFAILHAYGHIAIVAKTLVLNFIWSINYGVAARVLKSIPVCIAVPQYRVLRMYVYYIRIPRYPGSGILVLVLALLLQ